LYINLALRRIENNIIIGLDDADNVRVVWSSAWSRGLRGGGAPLWAIGRPTKMRIKDGGYCIPGLCIVTETLHQRLQIS
jgi:hypothetical protein